MNYLPNILIYIFQKKEKKKKVAKANQLPLKQLFLPNSLFKQLFSSKESHSQRNLSHPFEKPKMAKMGCAQNFASFIPALLLAAISLTIFPSHGIIHESLVTICSKTSDPSLCQKILDKDPRTFSADLPKLSLISINLTMKQADQNIESFSNLSKNTSAYAKYKKGFKHCVGIYHEMQGNIARAYEMSQQMLFRDNGPLIASKKLVLSCAKGIPINSLRIEAMHKVMILSLETSVSVNECAAANGHIQ